MKKIKLCALLLLSALAAFGQTRPVVISWTASTSSGITGYQVYRANGSTTSTAASTYTLLTTTNLAATATSYTDSTATIGQQYTYAVAAVAGVCTTAILTGAPTVVCGASILAPAGPINIPPTPTVSTITVTVP